MSIVSVTVSDSRLNNYIKTIRYAEYGKDMRSPLSNSVERLYAIVLTKPGTPKNGVTKDIINVHVNRIRTAVFGEEVRDALITGIELCYSARGISQSSSIVAYLNSLRNAQKAEDLKNAIIQSIARCCQDVKA